AQVALRIEKHRMPGRRLDTYEVTAQAAAYWFGTLGKNRKAENRAVILAHPDHVWRCAKTAEKLGFRPVIISMESVEYPSNSEQRWTRSTWRYRPYDVLARLLYWKRGWI
ncbi:MAG TPA: hypothetical protein VEA37_05985, partial [Flavobacterium sp.]|nr:hypothetical protein [Flavobacterium sp.]